MKRQMSCQANENRVEGYFAIVQDLAWGQTVKSSYGINLKMKIVNWVENSCDSTWTVAANQIKNWAKVESF